MSTMQRMTLIGLYNYEQTFDVDLFKNLTLPEGYDKPTFINSLLLEHGEKCVLYTDPDFFMQAIGMWSSKYSLELSRIHEALTAEYNPIWNYDRYEDWSDESGGRKASETAGNRSDTSETEGGRRSSSETTGEHTDESTTNAGRRSTSATDNSARTETETENGTRNVSETAGTSEKESVTAAGHKAQDQQNYNDTTTNDYDVTTTSITDAETEHQVSADNSGSYQPEWKETHDGGQNKVENDGTIGRHVEGTTQNLVESTNSKTNETGVDESKTVEVGSGTGKSVETGSGSTTTSESGVDNSKTAGSATDSSKTIQFGVDNSKTTNSGADNSKTVESSADKSKHLGHLWGNIGVTTSAAMVEEVVAQRFKISLYGTAAKMFANELLIGIW